METILTLHPEGKQGVNISRSKYETIREFILKTLKEAGELSFADLDDLAVDSLSETFDGKVTWYIVTVKLDLEARGEIERVKGKKTQHLRLKV
ncbi:MAG: hypothetical protein CMP48_00300 [Rickettsiales bacterium]|nr:hypothetical protein [Rickettsiales bacterium]|tara:strand:- start:614 stop:892 length:279 start_codon:yes stop_codon:yes gene_type:complete